MTISQRTFHIADLLKEVGCLPALAAQVMVLTSDPNCDFEKLTQVILSENVLAMRFLAVANSAFLLPGREISDLRLALVRLGLRRVRNMALCMGMHDMKPTDDPNGGLNRLDLWRFSLGTASCASYLAQRQGGVNPEDMYLVGLLHTIGLSALDQNANTEFKEALERAKLARVPLHEAELDIFGFHHAELGSRILTSWKLPGLFADIIQYSPVGVSIDEIPPETAKHVRLLRKAIAISRAITSGANGDGDPPAPLAELALTFGINPDTLAELAETVDREVDEMARAIGLDLPQVNLFRNAVAKSCQEIAQVGFEGIDELIARNELEAEMAAARDIQQRLLPSEMPDLPGFEIAAINKPSLRVSGDYYDAIPMENGSIGLVVADVSGKGLPASLLASNIQASLRTLATINNNPGEMLAAANAALFNSTEPDKFATLFLARIDGQQKQIVYAGAGHNPPLLLRADGTAEWLQSQGTPLGVVPQMEYPEVTVFFNPGDVMVIYTDGITEAHDSDDNEFTEVGLEAAVRACVDRSAACIITAISKAVSRHVRGAYTNITSGSNGEPVKDELIDDDFTMIVLKAS